MLWVEDSSFIDDLVRLDKFVNIDVNLTDSVNLINLTLKTILSVTEDELRINDLSLIKSVIIRSQSQWIFTSLKIKLICNQVLINVSIDIKLQFNFSTNSISISYIVVLLVIFDLITTLSWLDNLI